MIPREIYTLGAVQFNTQQLANLKGQLLAKREAKRLAEDDAINKYLNEQAGKLTPAGVRKIDLQDFEDKRQKWMLFSIQNKDRIRKEPLLKMEADRLYNEALATAQESKKAEEEKGDAIRLVSNPANRKAMNTERVFQDIALHDLALSDPRRKKIDYNAAWYRNPEFDFNKEFQESAKGQQKAYLREIPGTLNRETGKVQTEYGYLPNSVKQIAQDFSRSVNENPDKLDYYERRAKNMDAGEVVRLNTKLKPYFPNLQIDADHPLALAMAEAIEKAESIKDVNSEESKIYTSSLIEGRKSKEKNLANYDVIGKYIVNDKKLGIIDVTDPFTGNVSREKVLPVIYIDKYDYNLMTNKGKVEPYTDKIGRMKYFRILDNGDLQGAGGQVIDRVSVARANLDRTSLAEAGQIAGGALEPVNKTKGTKNRPY